MKKFFIVDGNAYVHRAYHALPLLSTSNNQQINAVYGFVRLLLKIKSSFKPEYIAVCFDYPSKNFRHKIFKDYKANRKPCDEVLTAQMPVAREAVDALDIARIEIKGYEADDLIATVAENNKKSGVQSIIVTGDKDILQLVEEENVLIWNDSKNVMYDAKKTEEKYGVSPKQLIDVFALMGDAVDNVPGVKGVGGKTAVKLIKEFGTLENVLLKADCIKGSAGKLIRQGKGEALVSKKLIELNREVPLDYKLENFESKNLNTDKIIPFFKRYEFRSLVEKYLPPFLKNSVSVAGKLKMECRCAGAADDVNRAADTSFGFSNEIVNTLEKASEVAELIEQSGSFALKTLKSASGFLKVHIVGVSMCVENRAFYFPIGHSDLTARQISAGEFKNIFSPLLSSSTVKKVGDDLKQERNIYKTLLGTDMNGLYFDVMLASYCLDPAKPHAIDNIAEEYLNFKVGESCLGKGAKKTAFADFSVEDSAKYANSVSAAVFATYKIFSSVIMERKLSPLFFNIEMPLIEILSEMEISGIKVDLSFLSKFNEKIISELKKIETGIYQMVGGEFNINSSKQLARIMFEKFNLPIVKKTKTGYSTDEEVLGELSSYEFPAAVLKYRELQKLKSAYIDPLQSRCASCGSRIHTAFNQAVTATGRLSSTEPNLQNIPIKSVYGREFRRVFISENDKIFLSADYSQIDLRVLAHVSRDPKLMEAFKNGVDIHSATAREIFNIPEGEPISDSLRNTAKSINFGIIYGMSPFGLSKQLNIPFEKAKEYISGYFERYRGVKLWMKQIVEQALKDGYVCTITRRIRYIPNLYSARVQVKNAAERIALNTPIQGSSADIIKTAMIDIYNEIKLRGYRSQLLLQVHDDLLFEVPPSETDDMISIIKDKMENSIVLSVPMAVDIKAGKNWGEMKKI